MEILRILDYIANEIWKNVHIILNYTVLWSQNEGISTSVQGPTTKAALSSLTVFPDVRAKAQKDFQGQRII